MDDDDSEDDEDSLHKGVNNITNIVENYHDDITDVVIKDGVRSIDAYAFTTSRGIRSITIPNSVTSIGNYAFYGLRDLETINIPNSVKSIGRRAFLFCTSLQAIVIPEGITEIEEGTFSDCCSLKSITFPKSLSKIDDKAFDECHALEQVDIPDGIKIIPPSAFECCTSLRKVTLPPSIEEFGSRAFRNCETLEQVDIPNGIKRIPQLAFWGCTSLRKETLPPTIEEFGSETFSRCEALEQVDIPSGIKRIPKSAFEGCTSLRKVTLSPSIEEFGTGAFYDCEALEQFDVPHGLPALKDGFNPLNVSCGSRSLELGKQILGNASSLASMTLKNVFYSTIGDIEDDDLGKVLELVSACPTLRQVDLPRNHLSVGVFEKLASQDIPRHLRLLQIYYQVKYTSWGEQMQEPEQHRKVWKEASSSPKHLLQVLERNPKLVIKTDKFWDDSEDERVRHHLDMNEYGCRGFTLRDSRWPELVETLHALEEEEKLRTGAANILYHLLHRHMDRRFLSHWQSDLSLDTKESGTSGINPNRESTELNND